MKKPLIVIFASRNDNTTMLRLSYSGAVSTYGGIPLIIPINTDIDDFPEICKIADGFLFAGGVDLDPSLYGEEKINDTVEVDEMRDRLETAGIKSALATGKPIFGICRGIQSVNVGMGGTLIQDIPTQRPSEVIHRQKENGETPTHRVDTVKGTFLNSIAGDSFMTNSFHHQAIKEPAPGLTVSAWSEDGLIEGLENVDGRFILLVQWHPEYTYSSDPVSRALFSSFINAARDGMDKQRPAKQEK